MCLPDTSQRKEIASRTLRSCVAAPALVLCAHSGARAQVSLPRVPRAAGAMVLPDPVRGQPADVAAATRSSQELRRAEALARVQAYAARFADQTPGGGRPREQQPCRRPAAQRSRRRARTPCRLQACSPSPASTGLIQSRTGPWPRRRIGTMLLTAWFEARDIGDSRG